MSQKLSGPVVSVIAVVVLLAIVIGGYFYARKATGQDAADAVDAGMKKLGPRQSPMSTDQIEQMKRANGKAATN